MKKKPKRERFIITPPVTMRAVRLIGQKAAPQIKYCPQCCGILKYWETTDGPVYACMHCCRVVEKEVSA